MSEEFLILRSLLHKSGLHYYTPACNRAAKDSRIRGYSTKGCLTQVGFRLGCGCKQLVPQCVTELGGVEARHRLAGRNRVVSYCN